MARKQSRIYIVFSLSTRQGEPKGQLGHDPRLNVRIFLSEMNTVIKILHSSTEYLYPWKYSRNEESVCPHTVLAQQTTCQGFGVRKSEVCNSDTSYMLHNEQQKGLLADVDDPFTQTV